MDIIYQKSGNSFLRITANHMCFTVLKSKTLTPTILDKVCKIATFNSLLANSYVYLQNVECDSLLMLNLFFWSEYLRVKQSADVIRSSITRSFGS